jgi:hypothetical protein
LTLRRFQGPRSNVKPSAKAAPVCTRLGAWGCGYYRGCFLVRLRTMRLILSRLMAITVLVTCIACPLVEVFDRWDHTLQNGNDTEYTFVVLVLCLGVLYLFAFALHGRLPYGSAAGFLNALRPSASRESEAVPFSEICIPISPPGVPLRV